MYNFDIIADRKHGHSKKYNFLATDVIPMWVADMDFDVAPEIYSALEKTLQHKVFGYHNLANEVKETVYKFVNTNYNTNFKNDDLIWLPSLVAGINIACRSLTDDDGSIVVLTPTYPPFIEAPKNTNRKVFTSALVEKENTWQINFSELEEIFSNPKNNVQLLLLCNPHNPTGRSWTKAELLKVHSLTKKYNIFVCSDEIHSNLILDKSAKHTSFSSLNQDAANRSITLMSPTKTFNIAGLTVAYMLISNKNIKDRVNNFTKGLYRDINTFGLIACKAALENGNNWLIALKKYLNENQTLVIDTFNKLDGFKIYKSEATYLAWIDCREFANKHSIECLFSFFKYAGIGISDGRAFFSKGFIRLNFATSKDILKKALSRIEKAIKNKY